MRKKPRRPRKKIDGIKVFMLADEKTQETILDGLLEEGLRRGDVEVIDGIPRPTVQGYNKAVLYAKRMGREMPPMSDRLKAKIEAEKEGDGESGTKTL